jgi:histidine triad (HIT) family protein
MQHTIFEKIIAREIPAEIVYEDDIVLAFLDIKPVNVGHTLVIPKKKFVNVFDADVDAFAHMAKVAQKIAVALRAVTKCDGVNISMNNEPAAGQEVFHAHIHIIPRFVDDGAFHGVRHLPYDETTAKQVASSIIQELS